MMLDFDFIEWDDANEAHIAANGISLDEILDVLRDPHSKPTWSRSSGRPAVIGETADGKTIIVIYEQRKDGKNTIIRPVTAYEIED